MILLKEGQKEAYIFNQYIKGFGQLRALFVISLDQSHFPDFPGLIHARIWQLSTLVEFLRCQQEDVQFWISFTTEGTCQRFQCQAINFLMRA